MYANRWTHRRVADTTAGRTNARDTDRAGYNEKHTTNPTARSIAVDSVAADHRSHLKIKNSGRLYNKCL